MKVYRIYCGNFEGSASYRSYEEAQAAAHFRTYCTGHDWEVREIYLP